MAIVRTDILMDLLGMTPEEVDRLYSQRRPDSDRPTFLVKLMEERGLEIPEEVIILPPYSTNKRV